MPSPLPHLTVAPSAIHGQGVYATTPIDSGAWIIDYAGELIPSAESKIREQAHLERGEIWCYSLGDGLYRDGSVRGNIARFINHACDPNCRVRVVDYIIWVTAARAIRAGDELTLDYFTGGVAGIPCRCCVGCLRTL